MPSARGRRVYQLSYCLAVLLQLVAFGRTSAPAAQSPQHQVYAVRFASIRYSVGNLVAGGDRTRAIDIAMTVWPVRMAAGRILLIDAGFYRDKFIEQWKPSGYMRPTEALSTGLGIAPEDVTDIVLSHIHWDHADGVDLFPRARIWIQREEFEHHIDSRGEQGAVLDRAIDPDVAAMLFRLRQEGRVQLVDGDDREIVPGVRVYTGGKHTFASQFVRIETRSGPVVVASDNAYLYENLEKHVAIAQTLDAASNLAAQQRMATLAGALARVIPGHDPLVFERFLVVRPGVVRID